MMHLIPADFIPTSDKNIEDLDGFDVEELAFKLRLTEFCVFFLFSQYNYLLNLIFAFYILQNPLKQ